MYQTLQNPRRFNHLSHPLHLLDVPIRTNILALQKPCLFANNPQQEMRRQFRCDKMSPHIPSIDERSRGGPTVVPESGGDVVIHHHSFSHIRVYNARMDRHDKEVRILRRDVLEQFDLGHLGADVRGSADGDGVGHRDRDHVGVDAYDGGVTVSGREEGTTRHHCSFNVGLICHRIDMSQEMDRCGRRRARGDGKVEDCYLECAPPVRRDGILNRMLLAV